MKSKAKKVLVTIPEPLLKRLDGRAKAERRSRSAELCVRLEASLKRANLAKTEEVAA